MENSLSSVRPDIAKEWSEKNLPLTPDDVSYGSHMKVWWKGECGHEWEATIHSRTGANKSGCPYCSGNRVLTGFNDLATRFPEIAEEWSERNLPKTPDKVLAFSNHKAWWKGKCGHEWFARIADRSSGHGCPYCTAHKILAGYNDLGSRYPELEAEWSDKNLPLTPDMIPVNKSGMYWWKCRDCGLEYRAWISSRIKNSSCPYCSGRIVVPGINDLVTTDPAIAAEWDYKKNKDADPKHIHRTSKEIFWWRSQFGYSWQAKVSERTLDNISCRPSGSEYRRMLPQLLFSLYAKRKKLRILFNSDALTGITIDIILPYLKLAVEMESEKKTLTKEQTVKQRVCEVCEYEYVLLKACDSSGEMAAQILEVLKSKHVYIASKIDEDIAQVQNAYLELLRTQLDSM